jgi:plasmid stabilization system protein ParE
MSVDLVHLWGYIRQKADVVIADRVESVIRQKIDLPARIHVVVKFLPVYSYLIVYRPESKPLQVVAILHGYRDVEQILSDRQ